MPIDINNFEEYFLMYTDNELSDEEKIEVERFVDQNPSLLEEFMLIKETVLVADNNIFINKESLYKTEANNSVSKYGELLNYFLDKELTNAEVLIVEKLLKENSTLAQEYAFLKQAVLIPDLSIIYPGKKSLYRKSKKNVPMFFIRMAAAAILLGGGLWFSIPYFNIEGNRQKTSRLVVGVTTNSGTKIFRQKIATANADVFVKKEAQPVVISQTTTNNLDQAINRNKGRHLFHKEKQAREINKEGLLANIPPEEKKLSNNLPKPDLNFKSNITSDQSVSRQLLDRTNENMVAAKENISPSYRSDFKVHPVAYIESDVNNDDGNQNLAQREFHRSKLGTFLKKASRTIVRNLKVFKDE